MTRMVRRGVATLTLAMIGSLALTGCQSGTSDRTDAAASSDGSSGVYGHYDRGLNHTAPYRRSNYERPAPPPAPVADNTPAPKPAKPAPRRTGSTVCAPASQAGYSSSGLAFPTGDVNSSAIIVHQSMPNEVTLGQDFTYSYHLCNLTDGTLQNVILTVETLDNMQIVSATPAASVGGSQAVWQLGDFGPRETKVVEVTARANQVGVASNCITVAYNNVLCAQTRVVQPALQLTKTGTERAQLCDNIEYVFEVRNTGSGMARNVHIRDTFPNGVTAGGQQSVDIPVGDLAAGEGKRVTITAKADRTGTFNNTATASADGGLTASSGTVSTVITQPTLAISADCTNTQFIGRNFTHSYTVRNTGNGDCADARVVVNMPAGAEFVRSSEGGAASGSSVAFNVGALPAGAQRTVSVTMRSTSAGDFSSTAAVSCGCADSAQDSCTTQVRGIPAILLEVIDVRDPVEVGEQETYVITVTNQGSAPDTNIRITATLPPQQEYISGSGATAASASGRTITFAPYPSLAPRQEIEWRVVVRATGEGDVRFGVEMNSDQLTSPVRETEATNLYQ